MEFTTTPQRLFHFFDKSSRKGKGERKSRSRVMTLSSLFLNTNQNVHSNVSGSQLDNISDFDLEGDQPFHERVAVSSVIILLAVAGLIGNAVTLITIAKVKELQKQSTNIFIANLAIADLLLVLIGSPTMVTSTLRNQWIFGQDICNLVAIATSTTSVVSLVQIMVIAINRYAVITNAKICTKVFKGWKNGAIILVIWICTLASQTLPAMGVIEGMSYSYSPRVYQCLLELAPGALTYYSYAAMVFYFIIQLGILTCYILITLKVRDSRRRVQNHIVSNSQQQTDNKITGDEMRLILQVFIIYIMFNICWTPFMVIEFLIVPMQVLPTLWHQVTMVLVFLNSVVNPCLYFIFSKSYRKHFKAIITVIR